MIIPRLRHGLVVLLVLAVTSPALAWDSKGHMMVAYIAYQQLTPTVRNRVDQLLARNPFHDQWLSKIPAGTPEAEKKRRVFMLAATWPDEIKANNSGYTDDGTENGNRPSGPASAQNVGYSDKLRHRCWHFVDQPFSLDGTPLPAVPVPNAQERIHLFRGVMASTTASDDLKSYDLTWLTVSRLTRLRSWALTPAASRW
jgi:hypothetical protein